MTQRGRVHEFVSGDHVADAQLYDFRVDSSRLLPVHTGWLDTHAIPILERGGSVILIGEADRTGTGFYNAGLSRRRVRAVETHLRGCLGGRFRPGSVQFARGVGEAGAEIFGISDGQSEDYHRGVRVLVSQLADAPRPRRRTPQPTPRQTAQPAVQTPRAYYQTEIRFVRGLTRAWTLTRNPTYGVRRSIPLPQRDHFLTSMRVEGFSASEALRMWDWYAEVGANRGDSDNQVRSGERIRQLQEDMRGAPGGTYTPPWQNYQPHRGLRGSTWQEEQRNGLDPRRE